jgi:mono/diheme cytochrome c family protein
MVGLQGLILLGGLMAAAMISADEGAKRLPRQTQGPLIHSLQGPDLYRAYCASCHGVDARGTEPVTPALVSQPPDLTMIAQRNGGLYPGDRVRRIIAGDEIVVAHGTREMPVWGPVFHQVEEDRDYGLIRLQNLTDHLRALQKK